MNVYKTMRDVYGEELRAQKKLRAKEQFTNDYYGALAHSAMFPGATPSSLGAMKTDTDKLGWDEQEEEETPEDGGNRPEGNYEEEEDDEEGGNYEEEEDDGNYEEEEDDEEEKENSSLSTLTPLGGRDPPIVGDRPAPYASAPYMMEEEEEEEEDLDPVRVDSLANTPWKPADLATPARQAVPGSAGTLGQLYPLSPSINFSTPTQGDTPEPQTLTKGTPEDITRQKLNKVNAARAAYMSSPQGSTERKENFAALQQAQEELQATFTAPSRGFVTTSGRTSKIPLRYNPTLGKGLRNLYD